MKTEDIGAVLAIETACFPRPWTLGHFMEELASTRGRSVVAELDGRLAGYLCLSVLFDEAELLDIAVDPLFHRRGVGKVLLDWCFEEATRLGADILRLEVRATSLPAITMYELSGFVKSGIRKGYYENCVDAVLMEKKLDRKEPACSLRQ